MSASVCLCLCVCVPMCLSVSDHIFGTAHQFLCACYLYGRGSVLLWRRSDMLCTSGFMHDVIFAHEPRSLGVSAQLKRSAHAALGLAIHSVQ